MAGPPLRFGIQTPVVTLLPRREPTWEAEAGPEELRQIALAADQLGYFHLTCSEHVGIPTQIAAVRGGRYYDPLATFGFMAALTRQIRFLTHVIVLPYHHPLAVAKRYGTLDRLSGGRLILGVGVGTLREEFELLGAEFKGRGERYADGLAALRAALGRRLPRYDGPHYRFDDFIIDPWAQQERMPIWLGGRTPRSLRRALESADGWDPFGLSSEAVRELLARARGWPQWSARREGFEIALGFDQALDLTAPGQLDAMREQVRRTRDAGATLIHVGFRSRSLAHYLDQLERFARQVVPEFA
jgi:probable F420-dependent oxidoreductase